LLNSIIYLSRTWKRIVSLLADSVFIFTAFWAAFYTRMGELTSFITELDNWLLLGSVILGTLAIFVRSGLYRAILRYMSIHAVVTICISAGLSALLLVLMSYYFQTFLPRSVPFIFATYLVIFSGGSRLFIRNYIHIHFQQQKQAVLVYGAGSAGRQLVTLIGQGADYRIVGFIDDNRSLQHITIQGIPVYSPASLERVVIGNNIKTVLLAMPSAKKGQKRVIVEKLAEFHLEVLTIPNLDDVLSGNMQIDQFQEVSIGDLLGRDAVAPQQELLQANTTDKVVMVTGAGGSIGSELCRQIIRQSPKAIVLFELSEFSLYQVEQDLVALSVEESLAVNIIPLLGSVQHMHRLEMVMRSFSVQTVYHAAAYKHVPLVEHNVIEGVRNNVFGTFFAAQAAINANVESFVLISTDKAVRPTNVMGTTKRIAELGLQALAEQQSNLYGVSSNQYTRFCMVRFGNVLGSSGSVIPLFKRQIAAGGPITVTHQKITRYFMTIPEAAQLVIQAGAMGKGGDVFVLDMGEPVKIVDLAKNLVHLSGLELKDVSNPYGDIAIKFTGLRPGEKLYEELLIGDYVIQTAHSRIMTATENMMPLNEYEALIEHLDIACHDFDHERIRELLLEAPTGFNPIDGIGDLVWQQNQK